MTEEERRILLTDEWLIVRHSGEIPEITFHSSVYFLTEDGDGPGLVLAEDELVGLKDAAILRYQEIILRDISLENFHKTIYRGVRRSLYNWHRYKAFVERQSIQSDDFYKTAAPALLLFLEQGVVAAGKDVPVNFINCSYQELLELAEEFGVTVDQLPADVAQFCLQ
ncbi:MAG: hypothetical protein JKY62_10140 [Desulfocapsa sp.]|uniref:Uncharacterized protein n=1 Tax=Desulfotalea psychrophila TaxID=84980 RepID=A0ABS3AUI0_9BACT|nr:hypothetical protein [Desulfocapsa sp.]MBN4048807.1 hypothetical protein [bacterium AH-315-N22]MBN4068750.1 hypothetical protein [Desulfotalea psychrophila]